MEIVCQLSLCIIFVHSKILVAWIILTSLENVVNRGISQMSMQAWHSLTKALPVTLSAAKGLAHL